MRVLGTGVFLVAATVVAGCGGPQMASVKGKVTWKGKGVKQAHVTFSPVAKSEKDKEPGKAGTGFTDDDGKFVISTYANYDGARVGQHTVSIILDDTNPARCKRSTQLTKEVKSGSNEFEFELQ